MLLFYVKTIKPEHPRTIKIKHTRRRAEDSGSGLGHTYRELGREKYVSIFVRNRELFGSKREVPHC